MTNNEGWVWRFGRLVWVWAICLGWELASWDAAATFSTSVLWCYIKQQSSENHVHYTHALTRGGWFAQHLPNTLFHHTNIVVIYY